MGRRTSFPLRQSFIQPTRNIRVFSMSVDANSLHWNWRLHGWIPCTLVSCRIRFSIGMAKGFFGTCSDFFENFAIAETRFPLTIESLILEILAGLGGERQIGSRLPSHRWKLLEEKIHESFRESIRTRDLASAAGIHPVHVARLFRSKTGVTPGEYLQHLRAQCAFRLMQDPERSLGEIASESGFADQSHMNRVLKRLVHGSPGNFRSLFKAI